MHPRSVGLVCLDELRLPLDHERLNLPARDVLLAPEVRRLIDEHGVLLSFGHQPGRQVDGVAHDSVLPSDVATHNAAEDTASRHTETARQADGLEHAHHVPARHDCARGVVNVHERRQTEDEQEEQPLVINQELVQVPLICVASPLHPYHELLRDPGAVLCRDVDAADLRKDDGNRPHLVDGAAVPTLEVLEDAPWDEPLTDVEQHGLREHLLGHALDTAALEGSLLHRRVRVLLGVEADNPVVAIRCPLKRGALDDCELDLFPSLRAQHCLTTSGQWLGDSNLLHWSACYDILEAALLATNLQDGDPPCAHTDVER
mmetsp:Transcript_89933/g.233164  ORF Transcript_89933/g.233164 Transcript_89933/m.233164 type:complete len:317 (-) Transcript_89933:651-1601(-)